MKSLLVASVVPLLASCTATRPSHVGEGALAPCPATPNCVSTLATDSAHAIEPLRYTRTMENAMAALIAAVDSMPRTRIAAQTENYMYAEFTSLVWRFVDDVEFVFDDEKEEIHFRSASRLGKSDLGVNRERMEEVRKLLNKALSGGAQPTAQPADTTSAPDGPEGTGVEPEEDGTGAPSGDAR